MTQKLIEFSLVLYLHFKFAHFTFDCWLKVVVDTKCQEN